MTEEKGARELTLKDHLLAQIKATGPLSIAQFMQTCLLHPTSGYYTTRDPLGVTGDFITAPEISQMFGEVIGLALAQTWMDQGAPNRFALAELGPGRGTLMADILRATKGVKGFHDAAEVHLIEASPVLQKAQLDILSGFNVTHHTAVTDLPKLPLFAVANEFFDALPIRQFTRDKDGWREHLIAARDGTLIMGLSDAAPIAALEHRLDDTTPDMRIETCPQATAIMSHLAEHIAQNGGMGLVIDYGDWRSNGDTFQALSNHKSVDPLTHLGTADLTAHVDFEALADAAKASGAKLSLMTPQGVFLERLGITARAQSLAGKLSGTALEQHIAAHKRLTHPDEMGTLFKVLGITPHGARPIAGLEF